MDDFENDDIKNKIAELLTDEVLADEEETKNIINMILMLSAILGDEELEESKQAIDVLLASKSKLNV